jgi:Arc/MetJ-type ribon-helix-helix transcriptional regulator
MAKKKQKEPKDSKESIRIPSRVVNFVDNLAELGIFGTNKSEVLRNLILEVINQISKDELVKKTLESRQFASHHQSDEKETTSKEKGV